jgi:hypothetical protein
MTPASSLLSRLFRSSEPRKPATPARRSRLEIESLEERVVMTANADVAWAFKQEPVKVFVLANDTGANLSVNSVTQGQHGSVAINGDGSVTYNPASGFTGADTFNYTASDGTSASVSMTVYDEAASTWPEHYSAPYVDATGWPIFDVGQAAQDYGVKYYTLGFMQTGQQSGNVPSWGGYQTYEVNSNDWFENQLEAQISTLRSLGGDVMVSFGGAAGLELAEAHTDVNVLKDHYQSVIDAYQLTHIDFDIEGAAAAHPASIDRRSQAISLLQQDAAAAGRELSVWFTLPVLPTGLTQEGINVLKSALKYGVKIDGVNIMAMDYGDSAAPNPQNQMGEYAIQAATSLFGQPKTLYGSTRTDAEVWHMVGITPMIGVNDVLTEVFNQQDAQEVVAFAQQHDIGRLGHWSANRDQHDPTLTYLDLPHDSGINQTKMEFSTIFNQFTDGTPPPPTNHNPVANADSATTLEGVPVTINVLSNDTDADGDTLSVASFGQPAHGTVTQSNGSLIYTPAAGYTGADAFSYVVSDGNGGTATGNVGVTMNSIPIGNLSPTANGDAPTTTMGQPVTISPLSNDTDPDGDALSIASFTQPAHGTVTQNGNQLVYTPAAGYTGADSFGYTVSDGHGGTATATVQLNVMPVIAPPTGLPPTGPSTSPGTDTANPVGVVMRRVHGQYQLFLYNAETGALVRRVSLPRTVVRKPAIQRVDLNRDGLADVLVRFQAGLQKRRLAFSGLDGSSLTV